MSRANHVDVYPYAVSRDLRITAECLEHGESASQQGSSEGLLDLSALPDARHQLRVTVHAESAASVTAAISNVAVAGVAKKVVARVIAPGSRRALALELQPGHSGFTGILDLPSGTLRDEAILEAHVYLDATPSGTAVAGLATERWSRIAWTPSMKIVIDPKPRKGKGIEITWEDFSSSSDQLRKHHHGAYFAIKSSSVVPALLLNESASVSPGFKPILMATSTNDGKRRLRDLLFDQISLSGWISLISAAIVDLGFALMRSTTTSSVLASWDDDSTWGELGQTLLPSSFTILTDWAPKLFPSSSTPHLDLCTLLTDESNWTELLLERIPLAVQTDQGPECLRAAEAYWGLP